VVAENNRQASDRRQAIYNRIEEVRTQLADSDSSIRADAARQFEAISRALGRIEGKLDKDA
jgi:hypothetical protein